MMASNLRYALDPAAFASELLGFRPDPWQLGVLRWTGKRLLLNCSRQSGKSTTTGILALHRAMFYPSSLVLLVSPSMRQSGELFRKVIDFHALLDDEMPRESNKLSMTLSNGSRIVSLPSSEATVRGFSGAALIIEDEASRVPDDLYRAMRPMLAVSGGRLILMSTPFGKRGHFFDEWTQGEGWERVIVKAEQCPRISSSFLEEERRSIGEWWFRQEYECEFMEIVDSVFTYDMVAGSMCDEVEPLFKVV